jgi:cobalt/nickel transport system permease protein
MLVISISKLPYKTIFRRTLIEIPFILFAFLMPFFGTGEKVVLLGFELYRSGLEAGAAIIAKGTLGVIASLILSASTTAREILRGLERLKMPGLMVQIASFMLRYINVVSDEMNRMKIARQSRGFNAKGVKDWKVLGNAAGALFIRSFERGERVHLAMMARGYSGSMPTEEGKNARRSDWLSALTLPTLSTAISLIVKV